MNKVLYEILLILMYNKFGNFAIKNSKHFMNLLNFCLYLVIRFGFRERSKII